MTTRKPEGDWASPGFDASGWAEAPGGFGTAETPGTAGALRTEWKTPDIWLRREFTLPEGPFADLQLDCFHDEDAEIFINGVAGGPADRLHHRLRGRPDRPGGPGRAQGRQERPGHPLPPDRRRPVHRRRPRRDPRGQVTALPRLGRTRCPPPESLEPWGRLAYLKLVRESGFLSIVASFVGRVSTRRLRIRGPGDGGLKPARHQELRSDENRSKSRYLRDLY